MGSAVIPVQQVEKVLVGTTNVSNPTLLINVGGVSYADGYREDLGGAVRVYFAAVQNGAIYLCCHTMAYDIDVPASTFYGVEVLVIG